LFNQIIDLLQVFQVSEGGDDLIAPVTLLVLALGIAGFAIIYLFGRGLKK